MSHHLTHKYQKGNKNIHAAHPLLTDRKINNSFTTNSLSSLSSDQLIELIKKYERILKKIKLNH